MNLLQLLQKVGSEYQAARDEAFGGHPLAKCIRTDLPDALKALVGEKALEGIKVVASAGQGRWSDFPWLALLHKDVTDSAMAGFYPVFLFEPGMQTCCLVLGQGAETIGRMYGAKAALGIVAARAEELRRVAGAWKAAGFVEGPFRTPSRLSDGANSDGLADPWSRSVAFGKRYQLSSPPTVSQLKDDIEGMVALYRIAVAARGPAQREEDDAIESLADSGELPTSGVDGAVRVAKHKEREVRLRNHKLARAAKRHHGYKCQGCGLTPSKAYPGAGEGLVDAHHLEPLASASAEGVQLTVEDFAVLCPSCHRAIHRLGCPALPKLQSVIPQWLKDAHRR